MRLVNMLPNSRLNKNDEDLVFEKTITDLQKTTTSVFRWAGAISAVIAIGSGLFIAGTVYIVLHFLAKVW